MADEKKKYTVLTYSHRFGDDVSVYENEEQAELSAIDIVLQLVSDVEPPYRLKLLGLIIEQQWGAALALYSEVVSHEHFTIEECEVHAADTFTADALVAQAKELRTKLKERMKAAEEDG